MLAFDKDKIIITSLREERSNLIPFHLHKNRCSRSPKEIAASIFCLPAKYSSSNDVLKQ